MDKSIQKQIRQFADMLPAIYKPCKMKVLGSELLKKDSKARDKDGKQILSKKIYNIDAQVPHNHYRAMKKIFERDGQDGLMKYAQEMRELKQSKATSN